MAPLDLDDELKLSYSDSRSFTILYGIVDPASADATNYQVMMVGIDKDWRDVGNQRSFTAMDLAFGTYRLRIRAASVAGNWDAAPVRELVIKIAPRSIYQYGHLSFICYCLYWLSESSGIS